MRQRARVVRASAVWPRVESKTLSGLVGLAVHLGLGEHDGNSLGWDLFVTEVVDTRTFALEAAAHAQRTHYRVVVILSDDRQPFREVMAMVISPRAWSAARCRRCARS